LAEGWLRREAICKGRLPNEKAAFFGGTAEGRELAAKLADLGFAVTVCVATDYGGRPDEGLWQYKLRVGRLAEPEMSAS
jgi:precorrin-6x reductase